MSARNPRRCARHRPPRIVRPEWKRPPSRPMWRERERIRSPGLYRAHQLECCRQAQAALAGQRCRFEFGALLIADAGKSDADLIASENLIFALGWRMLLIEDLALPASIRRSIGADVIEKSIATEDATAVQQHHPGKPACDTVQKADVDGVETVDDATCTDPAGDRDRVLLDRCHDGAEYRARHLR